MQESVIYQKILRRGLEQGQKQEAFSPIARLVARRIGAVDLDLQERLQRLSTAQLEELGEALLNFQQSTDLVAWLDDRGQ